MRARLVLSIATAALLIPTSGLAQVPPPVDEYSETVPTGDGSSQGPEEKKTPLPPEVRAAVQSQAGGDAAILEDIATSSRYGAPQREQKPVPHTREFGESESGKTAASAEQRAALSADVDAALAGGPGRLIGLLVFIAASLAVTIAVVLARKRRGPL